MEVPRALCEECGRNPVNRYRWSPVDGRPLYRKTCKPCIDRKRPMQPHDPKYYTKFKKPTCEDCGFVPVHPCQLDVDHVDGNKKNADPKNFRTRCANCHRLKTHLNREAANTAYRDR